MIRKIYICDRDRAVLDNFAGFFYGSSEFEVKTYINPDLLPDAQPHIMIIDSIFIDRIKALCAKYPATVMICAGMPGELRRIKMAYGGRYIRAFLKRPYSFYDVLEEIHYFVANAVTFKLLGRDLEEKLSNLMIRSGLAPQIKGYTYLYEAVMMTLENPAKYERKLTKALYPDIAARYNTSTACVERAMRFAINNAFEQGRLENINSAIGLRIFSRGEKPTNGELIALIVDRLVHEQRHMNNPTDDNER